MGAIGIVAEYNPFHRGHAYHIAQSRRLLGAERPVVAVMSGHWVQRGECAITDKWTRAGMALRDGADLVLELPTPWAASSAEGFARGAVDLLKATGVVDALSFGSESGDLDALERLAAASESEEYRDALRAELDKGKSFAESRERAAAHCLGNAAGLLKGSNDSLGVEYLRQVRKSWEIATIKRQGVSHDSDWETEDYASASHLRDLARRGAWEDLPRWMAPEDVDALRKAGLAWMGRVERAALARLRTMTEADWALIPDSGAGEGLPARLIRAAGKAGTLEEFYALAKTRRYAHARLRRLALWAFLGLTGEDRTAPAYLRVLGMNDRGKALLREMKTRAVLPVLTKPAHVRGLGERAGRQFALESRCTDLYGLCFDRVRPCGLEYVTGPVVYSADGILKR